MKKIVTILMATFIINVSQSQTNENSVNKDVSIEIPVTKAINICVENTNRSIEIKIWNEAKVKITTSIVFDAATAAADNNAWMERLNVKNKLVGNTLKIIAQANGTSSSNIRSNVDETYSIGDKKVSGEAIKKKDVLTIYIPVQNAICIKSKYSDVVVANDVNKIDIDIANGNLELNNIKNLSLTSKYANAYMGNVDNAEIDFMNGDINIGSLNNADIETKYAKVEIGIAKKITYSSSNDDYEIEEVDVIDGNKNYGNLRIGKLNESFTITGTNTDVKIKKISAGLKSINVDDKYATLKFPLKEIKNFNLSFEGVYSTIYKAFYQYTNDESRVTLSDGKNASYNVVMGSGSVKINIKCPNCTVDFK